MSFKLSGADCDLLTSYAIHQDSESIIAFCEATVDKQAGKPLPPDGSLVLTPDETDLMTALRAWKVA
jgi:hypothetical protein